VKEMLKMQMWKEAKQKQINKEIFKVK